jgi:hypothetical protein
MAAEKFILEFKNAQEDLCRVRFIYEDYAGSPIYIYGGAQPFVLGEFNTDDDLFKPIRAQQATIQVLASAGGLELEDFLTENDTDVIVAFDFGSFTNYWEGYLSQEDIEETWISTNHILTLRADEGFGRLKEVALNDGTGTNLSGPYDFFALIQNAMSDVVGTFFYSRIYSNLLHTSMSSAANQTGLDQSAVNVRTFEKAPNEFEDSYTVIEKVNRAWCQTVFKWNSLWMLVRIPEMFTTGNLVGFNTNRPTVGNRQAVNKRYDINVGVQEDVKPITPEMLKTVIKPSKTTTTIFKFELPPEILCNQSFQDGTLTGETSTQKTYSVVDWNRYKTSKETPTASTELWQRVYIFDTANEIYDNYLDIDREVGANSWVQSCDVELQAGDKIDITLEFKVEGNFGGDIQFMQVLFKRERSLQYRYGLNNEGQWIQATTTWDSANVPYLSTQLDPAALANEWQSYTFRSEGAPYAGKFRVLLYVPAIGSPGHHYKNIEINIRPQRDGGYDPAIVGDYDRYTIARTVKKASEEQIYLDDTDSAIVQGTIFETDGVTKTGDQWFRRTNFNGDDATAERLTFKRQHALAKWFMNRSYKTKLDVNLYGLKWQDSSSTYYPIGLINTIRFVDDAPAKIFAIVNLKQIDFMACTWSATLMEVFDVTVDSNEPTENDVHSFDYYYE